MRRLLGAATAFARHHRACNLHVDIDRSQNARFYTLLLLFYSLALLAFLIGLEENPPAYLLFSLGLLGPAARERLLALWPYPLSSPISFCW